MLSSAQQLTKLAKDYAASVEHSSSLERELKAMKLARRMEQRGICPDIDYDTKVAQILDMPVEKLATMEQAVEMAASGFRFGTTREDEPVDKVAGASGSDELTRWVESNAAWTA